jgi:putative ATPase
LAEEHGLGSLSLPAISAGIFGFPRERCAQVLLQAVASFLREHSKGRLREVRVCLYDAPTAEVFLAKARQQYGQIT